MNASCVLGDLAPSPDHVRLVIQDHTDRPAHLRPAMRVTEIPVASIHMIDQDQAARWKKMLRRLVRRRGTDMAIIGALLLAKQFGGLDSVDHPHMPLFVGAITSAVATSFKAELGTATHNFTNTTGDTIKTALYTSSATLGASTTAYSATNEISGTGYTAAGVTVANTTPTTSGTTAIYTWANAAWTTSTFTANGCLVYNSSKSNKAIFVIGFGSDQTVTAGTFTIQWPTADASNAIIRIA